MSGLSGLGVVWQSAGIPSLALRWVGGFGWLMFEKVFGAFMALYGFDLFALRGGGCR